MGQHIWPFTCLRNSLAVFFLLVRVAFETSSSTETPVPRSTYFWDKLFSLTLHEENRAIIGLHLFGIKDPSLCTRAIPSSDTYRLSVSESNLRTFSRQLTLPSRSVNRDVSSHILEWSILWFSFTSSIYWMRLSWRLSKCLERFEIALIVMFATFSS